MVAQAERRTGTDHPRVPSDGSSGLVALAVVAVLLASAGSGIVPGGFVGMDVLFVVAGFLLNAALLPEWTRTGQISLPTFYARCARRLLPAATLVLAAAFGLALLVLPRDRWTQTGWDVVAGGLYGLNWRLAEQGEVPVVAEGASGLLAHYWALGVHGQLTLLWPLLFVGVAGWAVRRWGRGPRRPLLFALGLLGAASFAWSVRLTTAEPERAYLVSTTRLWELALGGGIALLVARPGRLPGRVTGAVGWAGLAAVLVAMLALRPGPHFPGYLALLPALGTAAVLAAGTGRRGPAVLLGARPVRAAGAVAYPLYLWHWPLLVAAQARFGELRPVAGAAVLGGAATLAVLTHRYVERPLRAGAPRTWSAGQILRVAAVVPAVALIGGMLLQLSVWPPTPPSPLPVAARPSPGVSTPAPPAAPGAAALGPSPRQARAGIPVAQVASVVPRPAEADEDLSDVYRHNCFPAASSGTPKACLYGDRESEVTVVLAGDTQAASWVPALQAIAADRRWRLITYLKPGCPFLDLPVAGTDRRPATACAQWYRNVRAELVGAERPRLLLISNFRYQPIVGGRALSGAEADEALVAGMRRTWSGLAGPQLPVVLLRDGPVVDFGGARCVAANPKRLTRCATPRDDALAWGAGAAQRRAVADSGDVRLVDLNSAICPAQRCAAVIGGVLVYRDNRHLTATYARTLAPRLRSALNRVLRAG
ncbi:acyltransferase family protein [Plantactinospora sp. CA-290183]|uniref:acyltransferase family protein n=1 Tax=Plantactinospora sp. CA-290183 TaxID=3240006 RepID=UPI003D8E8E26